MEELNFKNAILENTNLQGAIFKKANIEGTNFNWSNLNNADFVGVKNLIKNTTASSKPGKNGVLTSR